MCRRSSSHSLDAWLVPLALYLGLVAWLTWPLSLHLATHLPAPRAGLPFDTLYDAWVLSYASHALTTAPSALADANIFHPDRSALFYGRAPWGALPHFLPPFLATGNPALALNLTFVSGIVLTAWALHLVVRRWTDSHAAGFLAAWTFLMTRWTLWECTPMLPSYAALQYFPAVMLLAAPDGPRALGWLVAATVVQGLVDVYLAVAVVTPLAVLASIQLLRARSRAAGFRLAIAVAVSALVLVAAYGGSLRVRLENPMLPTQSEWSAYPRPMAWPRDLIGPLAATSVPTAALVLIVVGAGLAAWRRDARAAPGHAWAVAALFTTVGMLMSLGPIAGVDPMLPAPVRALRESIYGVLRFPWRLGVPALMGLSVLAGLATAACLRAASHFLPGSIARTAPTALAALAAVAMYADYSRGFGAPPAAGRGPLPETYRIAAPIAPDAPIVRMLRAADGPVLELPVAPRGVSFWVHREAMYRSIFHWRPLVNGYTSYWPSGFPDRMALAERLPAPDALARLRDDTGVETIVVHTARLPQERRTVWLALAEAVVRDDLRFAGRDGGDLVFAVQTP